MKRFILWSIFLGFSFTGFSEEQVCEFEGARVVINDNDGSKSWQFSVDGQTEAGTNDFLKETFKGAEAKEAIKNIFKDMDVALMDESLMNKSLLDSMASFTLFTLEDKKKSETPMLLGVVQSEDGKTIGRWIGMFECMNKLVVIKCD